MDKGLVELPLELIESRAKHVKTLNLAENALRSFRHLERFTALDTLVLDKNGLAGLAGFPRLDHVSTLWFNNNAVTDMADFLDEVEAAFPNLVRRCPMGRSLPDGTLASCHNALRLIATWMLV